MFLRFLSNYFFLQPLRQVTQAPTTAAEGKRGLNFGRVANFDFLFFSRTDASPFSLVMVRQRKKLRRSAGHVEESQMLLRLHVWQDCL